MLGKTRLFFSFSGAICFFYTTYPRVELLERIIQERDIVQTTAITVEELGEERDKIGENYRK
jgi:hypothetical protein